MVAILSRPQCVKGVQILSKSWAVFVVLVINAYRDIFTNKLTILLLSIIAYHYIILISFFFSYYAK